MNSKQEEYYQIISQRSINLSDDYSRCRSFIG